MLIDPRSLSVIKSLEARKAELRAAQQANKNIEEMLDEREKDEFNESGLDGIIQRIDKVINYIETEEHI